MFENWMGAEEFRKGVQGYLKQYAFRATSAGDFLDSLSTSSKRDVTKPFSTFLNQAGVPIVSVALECKGGAASLQLEQSRFLPTGSKGDTKQVWSIPLCVRYGTGTTGQSQCMLMTQATETVALKGAKGCPAWVEANDKAVGYYRVQYKGGLRAALTSGLCDVVMFPIGPFVNRRYRDEILPLAREKGVGTVCFKTFGAGKLLGDTTGYNQPLTERPRGKFSSGGNENPVAPQLPRLGVAECLHYTLTTGPDVALLGMSFPNEQDAVFQAWEEFRPLPVATLREIEHRAALAIAGKGACWWNPPAA